MQNLGRHSVPHQPLNPGDNICQLASRVWTDHKACQLSIIAIQTGTLIRKTAVILWRPQNDEARPGGSLLARVGGWRPHLATRQGGT